VVWEIGGERGGGWGVLAAGGREGGREGGRKVCDRCTC